MYTTRTVCVMVSALFATGWTSAQAASDVECAQYAETTVAQHADNLRLGCGYSGLRWHDNKLGHFVFCKAADKNTIDAEIQVRAAMLQQCSPDVVEDPQPQEEVQPEQAPDSDEPPVQEEDGDEPLELELNDLPDEEEGLDDEGFIEEG